jgi:hypothetical protein
VPFEHVPWQQSKLSTHAVFNGMHSQRPDGLQIPEQQSALLWQ